MASPEEKISNEGATKAKRGLGSFVRDNRDALMILGMGLTSASRPGGSFNEGVSRGMAASNSMFGRDQARKQSMLAEKISNEKRERINAFLKGLSPEQRALAMNDPENYVKQAQNASFKGESGNMYERYVRQQVESGVPLKDAIMAANELKPASPLDKFAQGMLSSGDRALDLSAAESNKGMKYATAQANHDLLTSMEEGFLSGKEGAFNAGDLGNSLMTMATETPGIGRFAAPFRSEELKQYSGGVEGLIDSWGREMTGAAMPDSERWDYRERLGMRPNDSPETVRIKRRNRQVIVDALKYGSGQGQEIKLQIYNEMLSTLDDPYEGQGLDPAKQKRLEELRRKKAEGTLGQ